MLMIRKTVMKQFKKKIAVFGCSWSQGLYPDLDNWVKELAKLLPDYEFYNFSLGGTSLAYSIHLLEQIYDSDINFDITIFQATSEGRLTWWKSHNIFNFLERHGDNLFHIDKKNINDYVDKINYGTVFSKSDLNKNDKIFGRQYYSRLNLDMTSIELRSLLEFADKRVNILFSHRSMKKYGLNYLSVFDTLGEENFKKFVIDEGEHFSNAGNKWQALWILDKLKQKKLIGLST